MRLLHTSDWHLGHALKDVARDREHAAFLAWLRELCGREAPDVMVVTGDVFDSATPPASAERMWFELLAGLRADRPAMDIVAIAGNHDSPARLSAASPVLRELGVFVVGALPRTAGGAIDLDRVVVPVAGGRGLVCAVPFLRPADLPDAEDPVAAVYAEVLAGARARRRPGQHLIVTGHLYLTGAEPSAASERRISVGGQEAALPARLGLLDDDLAYVALGHLHRAQRVGRDTVRYAGAPLPLALDEASYRHQVVLAELGAATEIRIVDVPQAIEIARIPRHGAAPLPEVLAELAALPAGRAGDPARPYLEVVVALERPEPRLRQTIEAALEGKHARLVRLGVEATGDGAALADRIAARRLAELDPREVFGRLWARDHVEPPGAAVEAGFDRLLAEVRGDAADPEAPCES